MDEAVDSQQKDDHAERSQLSGWLWEPWFAKLWWTAIPVWWIGMAASTRSDTLEAFYRGGIAGYLNVLFFPGTALMVLGVGYLRERLDRFVWQGEGMPLSDEEEEDLFQTRIRQEHNRFLDGIGKGTDMFDPRSGPLWIGNPLNPLNAGYIDPHTGKHR
ncbi:MULTISPECIES: hypothetical protein [Sphingobium]|uniref:Uncharacterized protein n=3 Tax=Sphingobium TaxID=165695 RepID=T0HKB7_9SPHN|nr:MULTISPECIES: hypothetical protein [Sphingobium]EQB16766.1 hypothetical protein RLDS_06515 [Sphingobium lactosutens DS20]QDC36616.1 hypothetical protein FIL70_04510 [Sphingobium fuliginis ATCC 27551]QNG43899.1 hypothetical protein H3V42_18505 [Sphingobium yanoikuyae]